MNRFVFLIAFTVTIFSAYSHQKDSVDQQIDRRKLTRLVVGSGVGYAASMFALGKIWYSDFDRQSFAFFNDAKEWYQVDKLGHFYSTYQLSSLAGKALTGCGVRETRATVLGSIAAFTMVSSIEIFDGYSAGYGASASDLAANTTGVLLYFGQQRLWGEQRIVPKFSFHRSGFAHLRPSLLGSNLAEEIVKDYNGQTYWMSVDMDKFLEFPVWLNLAVGYGAENFTSADPQTNLANGLNPYRQLYLSVDFDLTGIKTKSRFVKSLIAVVNLIHLPAPAIEFNAKSTKFRAFYF